jgi:phosphoserine phosphatase
LAIATLIAAGRLDDRLLAQALERVPGARLEQWIDPGDAADIGCDGDPRQLRADFESIEGLDVAVWPTGRHPPKIFVADMDSTIIGQECIDELADYAGVKADVAAVTERAMRGEIDFAEALAERVRLLEGLDVRQIAKCRRARIRPNPGAETLVVTLNKYRVRTNIVSGGFVDFVRPVARNLRFQGMKANYLGIADGKLTGTTVGKVVDAGAKRRFAEMLAATAGVGPEQVVAIGDGANDIPLVAWAGLGIAYRPKEALDAIADAAIRHHDLTAALWMLGIPKSEWIILPKPRSRAAV